jgi:hypothetical protein
MRKLLLTSTALVAASSMINYTYAADVSVTGGFEWGYTDQNSEIAASNGDSFRVDNEVVITFSNKTDTGLTITGRYDVDGDAAVVDESSLSISGGFGTIRLGQDDGVEDAFGIGEGDLVGEEQAFAVGSASILTQASESGNTDDNKISYFTPAMGGLTAGVSFTDSGANEGTSTDRTSMGAAYSMAFAGGSATIEYNQGSTESATAGGNSTDHVNYGVTITMGAIQGIVSTATRENGTSDEEATGFALKYDMGGGMYVAGMVTNADDDGQVAASGASEEYKASVGEIGYTVAPGLTAKVTYIDYDYNQGGNTLPAGNDNGSATKLTLTAAF